MILSHVCCLQADTAETYITKNDHWITTDFKLTTTGNNAYILTPSLGDATIYIGFRKIPTPTQQSLNPEMNFWVERYLRLFPSFLPQFFCTLHRRRSQQIKCGKQRTMELDTTTANEDETNNTHKSPILHRFNYKVL